MDEEDIEKRIAFPVTTTDSPVKTKDVATWPWLDYVASGEEGFSLEESTMLPPRLVMVFLGLALAKAITAAEKPKGPVSVSGEALPPGAIARLGTTRLRPGDLLGPF